jgi:transcriptional regulator with XRE-family HTH domain
VFFCHYWWKQNKEEVMSFGDFVRELRLGIGLSLRKFCDLAGLDASNWSKIERGRLPLSYERGELENISQILKLERGSQHYQKFFDLAIVASKKIPDYVYSDPEILSALPVFFRAAHGDRPTEEERQKIIDLLKTR